MTDTKKSERIVLVLLAFVAFTGITVAWSSDRIDEVMGTDQGIECQNGHMLKRVSGTWQCTSVAAGGNPFDQSLNTTDVVNFDEMYANLIFGDVYTDRIEDSGGTGITLIGTVLPSMGGGLPIHDFGSSSYYVDEIHGAQLCNATHCESIDDVLSMTASGSSNPFDQWLNTTDNVDFNDVDTNTGSIDTLETTTQLTLGSGVSGADVDYYSGTKLHMVGEPEEFLLSDIAYGNRTFTIINVSDGTTYKTITIQAGPGFVREYYDYVGGVGKYIDYIPSADTIDYNQFRLCGSWGCIDSDSFAPATTSTDLGNTTDLFADIYATGTLSNGTDSINIDEVIAGSTNVPHDQDLNTTNSVHFESVEVGTSTNHLTLNKTTTDSNFVAEYFDGFSTWRGGGIWKYDSGHFYFTPYNSISDILGKANNRWDILYSDNIANGTHSATTDDIIYYANNPTPAFDGNISEINVSNMTIYRESDDIFIEYDTDDNYIHLVSGTDDGPLDFVQIGGGDANEKFIIEPNQTVNLDVAGLFKVAGDYTFTTIGILFGASGTYEGNNWFLFNAQPTLNVTGAAGIFRFNPNYMVGEPHKAKVLELIPDTHDANVNDDFRIVDMDSNVNVYAFSNDHATQEWRYFSVGNKFTFGNIAGIINNNVTEIGYAAKGGLNRVNFGTPSSAGTLNQTGFSCTGFGDITNPEPQDNIYCFTSDGGENLYEDSVMNQTNGGYSLWNLPHAEVWNVTENGYTITISALNTWYNFTGILAGETDEFTLDNGIIPTHDGRYKIDWSVSFSGTGGSTHAVSLLVNGTEHTPCRSYRKLGTAGDVGNMGGTCIITAWANANITGAVMDINAPAQNIDVWSMNANVMRLGEI